MYSEDLAKEIERRRTDPMVVLPTRPIKLYELQNLFDDLPKSVVNAHVKALVERGLVKRETKMTRGRRIKWILPITS